jgi:hypothetical protein
MDGRQFRIAIGLPSARRSGTWRIWSNPKGDIYVANRCLGGIYKASFHRDRRCQFGFTSEYAEIASDRFDLRTRHLERWSLPDCAIVRAVQILVPETELRMASSHEENKITWLETPPPGSIGTISLFITRSDYPFAVPSGIPGALIVGRMETSIRTGWIAYAHTYPDSRLANSIEIEKSRLNAVLANIVVPPGTRASLWDSKDDHVRHVLELSCDRGECTPP